MKIKTLIICASLSLTLSGCSFYRLGGSGAGLNCATDTDAVVDFLSDEGSLHTFALVPSGSIGIPGADQMVYYRLYFHLDSAKQIAVLYRIEKDRSRKAPTLPPPTATPPAPRQRVLMTSQAADAPHELGGPPRPGYKPYAVDAQMVDGEWMILREYDPGYDDFSLLRNGRMIASVNGAGFGLDTMFPGIDVAMRYFTWDADGRYIVFVRRQPYRKDGGEGFPEPEIDVWHYGRPNAGLERYNTNVHQYFVWHGAQYDVREEFRSLLR